MITIHTEEDFAEMRKAGKLAKETLDYITPYVIPGTSTGYIDDLIEEFIISNNAIPATKGYKGYPKSSCISIGKIVNHGIPSYNTFIKETDTLNIDITVILNGWYGDTSRMFVMKKAKVKDRLLSERTFEAMWAGIEQVKPGNTLRDIGEAIQKIAEEKRNYLSFSVIENYVGHGIGREFHMPPDVRHFRYPRFYNLGETPAIELQKGMIFTIEPMLNLGSAQTKLLSDGWTCITKDGGTSAQWEHTIGVTATGYEVFTL